MMTINSMNRRINEITCGISKGTQTLPRLIPTCNHIIHTIRFSTKCTVLTIRVVNNANDALLVMILHDWNNAEAIYIGNMYIIIDVLFI